MKYNLLGIDVGTTSIKTTVFDAGLTEIASSNTDYVLDVHGDNVEFDCNRYYEIIRTEIDRLDMDIYALAVDTQCETLILTDDAGNPVRKAIVWLDNRATAEAEEIEQHFGRQLVYEVTGQPEITATWPACKLLWIKRNEPDVWAKTKKIFLLEDYILYKLTGKFVSEKTLQSSTIYFDIRNTVWWQEMLDYIGIDASMLPTLYDSAKYIGDYNGIKIVTGAIDQIAGAIGAGITHRGMSSEMTGTTMVVFTPCEHIPPYDSDSIVPCHYNYDGKYCLISWTPTAGMALKWFRNALCENFTFHMLDQLAEQIPVGSDGLTFLPYLCGSTMPKYNPYARGSFTGLTTEHTRGHFVRSIMEAVACMLKGNLDYLNFQGEEIRSMGGGANSSLWCQMKADLIGKRIVTLEKNETACLGSAILAGLGTGLFSSIDEAASGIRIKNVYEPSNTDYSEVYARYHTYDQILNVRK